MVTLLNLGPAGTIEYIGRLVPAGSDENTVYARSLRLGEEDTGEVVHVPAGKRLVIRVGDLSIDSEELDAKSPKGRGGYAPVADTIWTWYQIAGVEDVKLLMLLLAASRRLDAAHVFWSETMGALEETPTLAGNLRRSALFRALAMAEVTLISLSREMEMINRLEKEFSLGLQMSEKFESNMRVLRQMRNALEHIDDRAMGQATDGTADSAMSIFFQPYFVDQGIVTYAGDALSFTEGVPLVLIECRELVKSVIDLRPRC